MIVLSRASWDRLLYKFIDSSSTYMCLQCVRACSFSSALPLLPLLLHSACSVHRSRLASTLWSMNTVNKCPEHPWGQGAYGTGPRLCLEVRSSLEGKVGRKGAARACPRGPPTNEHANSERLGTDPKQKQQATTSKGRPRWPPSRSHYQCGIGLKADLPKKSRMVKPWRLPGCCADLPTDCNLS